MISKSNECIGENMHSEAKYDKTEMIDSGAGILRQL